LMDALLIAALVSFLGLIAGWVVLPASPAEKAATPEVAVAQRESTA